ncbi:MAG: SulP family inorganic anion transporter [Bacteroidetes bacterium]|nr:SulP family inorganic anion transporter [Bacteroidota bacterium]
MSAANTEVPRGNLVGLVKYWKSDLVSGFLVFLIALPLCLGIALACGYPAIAGVFTAIIGGILATFISDSELTIKGPAAGLIVIAIGAVQDFGFTFGKDPAADIQAYKLALGVGVAAGIIQILFGLFRAGIVAEFFPTSVVHGMLAAIGVIIIAKQVPVVLGVSPEGEPLELLWKIPENILHMNPAIGIIGITSMLTMFLWPLVKNKYLKMIPAPLVVLVLAVPMGMYFHLTKDHTYVFNGHEYELGEQFLVRMPDRVFGMFDEITFPDFSGLATVVGWKWVMMFALIGTLESMLSAKAVDMIDPYQRKTNLDRDNLAVGLGNTLCSFVGGLPMISEIVRSKANIDNGAKTRFANMFHALFLLVCVALIPTVLHLIPLAALGGMLVYTGFRLASPREIRHVFEIGREQLVIFVSTMVAVLATDLLIGIAIGIGVKFGIHIINGVPISSLFKPYVDIKQTNENSYVIIARQSAVFSNWIPLKKQIESVLQDERITNVTVDLSDTKVVDHTVMEKLHELQKEFEQHGRTLKIVGLEDHQSLSRHPHEARRKPKRAIIRITVIAEASLEQRLTGKFMELGAKGYTVVDCRGGSIRTPPEERKPKVRIEAIVSPSVGNRILCYLADEILDEFSVAVSTENVEVIQGDYF